MRRTALVIAAALAISSCTINPAAAQVAELRNPQGIAHELLEADRAFAAQAADDTVVAALPAMFDDQVIMPLPTGKFATGKEAAITALRANPANIESKATWAPVRAGLSADGLHGFTYGFMTIRADGKPDARAKYLAYWVKRPKGWQVAAYKRAPSPPGEVQTELRPAILPQRLVPPTRDRHVIETHRASLVAAEKTFSDRAQLIGLGPAFVEFGSPGAMNMGQGPDVLLGNQAIGGVMPPDPKSPVEWAADAGALVASSGDLGVIWGHIRPHVPRPAGQPQASAFFTVWHRASPQAPWRYIAE
ncbi:MAG TPA: DUF4440 domain-containing protein [Sphingomicrobium sp.]|nr:DUF4440 domain-containing protein [Sphingomicrobium sp.]